MTINQSDRSFMFAGFMSRPLHNLIKKLRPKTYEEDEHHLRFAILEANFTIWDWASRLKKIVFHLHENLKLCDKEKSPKKNHLQEGKVRKRKRISKRIIGVNVHASHQDRKKKRKKDTS